MYHLKEFQRFDMEAFLNKKKLVVVNIRENKDYNTHQHLGTIVECYIAEDETQYKQKDGEYTTNKFEKLALKVNKDVNVPLDAVVEPVNAVGKIYGDYGNKLSVKCDDIRVILSPTKKAQFMRGFHQNTSSLKLETPSTKTAVLGVSKIIIVTVERSV